MTTQEINRAFHEAVGREPEFVEVGLTTAQYEYPDYCADPRLVIEVMREREDSDEFVEFISDVSLEELKEFNIRGFVLIDLILDQTGKLALLALEWLGKEAGT